MTKSNRLQSLDVLRGFDLCLLFCIGGIIAGRFLSGLQNYIPEPTYLFWRELAGAVLLYFLLKLMRDKGIFLKA